MNPYTSRRRATPAQLAAVVAEWLESDEAAEVVASHARNAVGGCICGERNIEEPFTKHALAAGWRRR